MQYITDIGLEVHVELSTKSKMFCNCPVVDPIVAEPNSAVCPVCLGMPGTLPVVNKQAVAYAIRAGLALNCSVAQRSIFARKNYFYPDLPKGYQISQYEYPITYEGWICVSTAQGEKKICITRAHLEEDTGKLEHVNDKGRPYSLVDLNRAGIPLLEIVTEPDMHNVEEVRAYSQELRLLLRAIDITSGDMEKGAMRFEANLSMRENENAPLGTRVEIKNLNSIHSMEKAILYEMERQEKILRSGGAVAQETLGWDESNNRTFSQRSKEEAHDYRYFPEPDLPPLIIEQDWIDTIAANMPETPAQKRVRYCEEYALPPEKGEALIQDKTISHYFDEAIQYAEGIQPEVVANWVLGDIFSWMNDSGENVDDLKVSPSGLLELIRLHHDNVVNKSSAQSILKEMLRSGSSAETILQEKGLQQISSSDELEALVRETIQAHPDEVASYKAGKETLFNWFFGQVMRASQGKADPQKTRQILKDALTE